MSDFWIEGEPKSSGYYLVLVRSGGHQQGNPWPFLARVFIDDRDVLSHEKIACGRPVYMDHYSGDDRWRAYVGGHVVAYCDPSPENFVRALAETKEFYERQAVSQSRSEEQ